MKAARGSRGRLRPAHTSPPKYLKIEKNRQLTNSVLGPGGGCVEFLCTFKRDFKNKIKFKRWFKALQSRKPSTFFVLPWGKKKKTTSPQPSLDQALKGACIEVALSNSVSRPIGNSGATGDPGEMGRGDCLQTQKYLCLSHYFSGFPSVWWL